MGSQESAPSQRKSRSADNSEGVRERVQCALPARTADPGHYESVALQWPGADTRVRPPVGPRPRRELKHERGGRSSDLYRRCNSKAECRLLSEKLWKSAEKNWRQA